MRNRIYHSGICRLVLRLAGSGFLIAATHGLFGQPVSLLPSDELGVLDYFGRSVAIDGTTAIVARDGDNQQGLSAGAVHIYEFNVDGSNQWTHVAKVFGDAGGNFDSFGSSVAIDGDVVVVGAKGDDDLARNAGAVYVFERDAGGANQWGRTALLTASDAGENRGFGFSVDVSAERIIVGALFVVELSAFGREEGENIGSAYIYDRENGQWVEKVKLDPIDPVPFDNYGKVVAISGDTAVVGADAGDDNNPAPGSAYVFERNSGGTDQWVQSARLTNGEEKDRFGAAVSVSGDLVAVGAPGHQEGTTANTGAVYLFERGDGNQWQQTARVIPGGIAENDAFGDGLKLRSHAFVAGAGGTEVNGFTSAGAVYVFERQQNDQWTQAAHLTRQPRKRSEFFGLAVALSGDKVVAGLVDRDSEPVQGGEAFIYTVPVSPPPPPPPPPPPEGDIFSGGDDLGGGWRESPWFGFYNTNFDPWVFHAEHAWTYVDSSSTAEATFLFDLSSGGWFFSGETLYPNLFNFGRNAWVFYFAGTSNPRNYVDLASGEFFDM